MTDIFLSLIHIYYFLQFFERLFTVRKLYGGYRRVQGYGGVYAFHTCLLYTSTVDVEARFRLAELQVYVCHLEDRIFVDLRH